MSSASTKRTSFASASTSAFKSLPPPSYRLIGSFAPDPIKELEKRYLQQTDPILRCTLLLQTLRTLYEEEKEEKEEKEEREPIPIKSLVKPLVPYFSAASRQVIRTIHSLFQPTPTEILHVLDGFLDRIETGQRQILDTVTKTIHEKRYQTILVFGHHPLLHSIVHSLGSEYHIYSCVDANDKTPLPAGDNLSRYTYFQLNALSYVMSEVDVVLLGCIEIMSNGDMKAPVGTALVAMMAHHHHIPVLVCCETLSLTKKVETVIHIKEINKKDHYTIGVYDYDITPAGLISQIITEKGCIHPLSVNGLL